MKFRVKSKFWIEDETGRPLFGAGKERILRTIDDLGSIKAAAETLKMSYRAVWGKIKTTEERLGIKLIETAPGGGQDRGTRLTAEARQLLESFHRLRELGNEQADELFSGLFSGIEKDT